MKYLSLLIIVTACWCCSQKESAEKCVVRQEQIVETKPVEIILKDLFCLEQVCIKDSFLLLIDRCDSCMFHVYDMKRDSLVVSFGVRGQGPNDFLYPMFLSGTDVKDCDSVYCYDVNSRMIKSFAWKYVTSGKTSDMGRFDLSEKIAGSPDLTKIDEEYWGTLDYIQSGIYFKYAEYEDSLVWTAYPESLLKYSQGLGLQSRIGVHPTRKTLVAGMRYYNKLFLYTSAGTLQREVQIGDDDIFPVVDEKKKTVLEQSTLCCQAIRITENEVYVLYCGWPLNEAANEKSTSRILVFDQKLNYRRTYILPYKAVSFAVDNDSRMLAYIGLKGEQFIIGIIQTEN